MMQLELWRAGILAFETVRDYANPFLDLSVMAEFKGPSGRTIRREAYWDGGRSYKVSFAPTEVGVWNYTLSAPADSGLDGVNGEVEAIPYSGQLDIYKHGFLKVSNNGRYFTYDDGTPFFWLGDTHWGFIAGEKWDESNYEKTDSMFKYMADKRAAQDFTIYQTNLRSESWMRMPGRKSATHFWDDDHIGILPDVSFYQEEVDKRMQYLADLGFVNALGFAWGSSVVGRLDLQKNLARYIVARYGALPMVWTLAGESAGYFASQRQECIDGWREVALLVQELDGYGQLQTTHYTNERPYCDYYVDEDWFDFTLNQAGHGDLPISTTYIEEHRKNHPDKPFVEAESLYEYCSTLEPNGSRLCTAGMMRRIAYLTMQLGGAGYTYGAQGIWDHVWDKPKEPNPFNRFNQFGITWYEAIEAPGAEQLRYMRRMYEEQKWYEMAPANELKPQGDSFSDPLFAGVMDPQVMATPDRSRVLSYYPESVFRPIAMCGLTAGTYEVQWFDPRSGEYISVGEIAPENGNWAGLGRPGAGDWMLVLTAK